MAQIGTGVSILFRHGGYIIEIPLLCCTSYNIYYVNQRKTEARKLQTLLIIITN